MRRVLGAGLLLGLTSLAPASSAVADDGPRPVLMVIANQDFYYQEYAETGESLEAAGLEVVVAAATTETSPSHEGFVAPDLALADVNAQDYSAIVFVGGWGASQYQYAFEGTYHDAAYRADPRVAKGVNQLINDFVHARAPLAAICHGVSILAYARVDGVSPLAGRVVVGSSMLSPAFDLGGSELSRVPSRWHIEENGGVMLASGSVGDPQTSADDVYVDGNIITAENYEAAGLLASSLARAISVR